MSSWGFSFFSVWDAILNGSLILLWKGTSEHAGERTVGEPPEKCESPHSLLQMLSLLGFYPTQRPGELLCSNCSFSHLVYYHYYICVIILFILFSILFHFIFLRQGLMCPRLISNLFQSWERLSAAEFWDCRRAPPCLVSCMIFLLNWYPELLCNHHLGSH